MKVSLHIGVHHQVHIALTVAGIGVLEAVQLLRQRTQGLGEQGQLFSLHRDLTPAGTEYFAFHADDVAQVPLAELTEGFLADLIDLYIDLDAAAAILQVDEVGLAHITPAHNTAGNGYMTALKAIVKAIHNFLGMGIYIKTGDLIGILTRFHQFIELVPSDLEQFRKALAVLNFLLYGGIVPFTHLFYTPCIINVTFLFYHVLAVCPAAEFDFFP